MKKLMLLFLFFILCSCAGNSYSCSGCKSCYCAVPGVIGKKPMARYCFDCIDDTKDRIRTEALKDITETCSGGFNIVKEEFGIIHFECKQPGKVEEEK